uniref:cysteine dioxygenase n=1 Tax=Oryza sativa subsp. japonica TaxID=39947 RepID=Q7F9E0_ORYSJ|nr:OSJNBa0042D13.5 [Oryza sativa Japonica Group]
MPPLLGVYDFTLGLPPPPPTGVSACTAGLYAAVVGRLRLHRRPASVAADWCPRLYGWLVTPPFMGVHVFADRLAFAAADWIQIQICIKGIHGFKLISYAPGMDQSEHHRPACLRRRRLVFPPARLAFMPPLLGVYVFTDRLAFAAADWCFRLHGWPLCRRCWASTSSPTGLPSPPPTGVSACTAGLLCRRCWASTSSPTGLPSPLPTGVSACTDGLYAAVVGRLRLHRPAAASAADWCHRLHGWPVITPTDAIFFTAGYIAASVSSTQAAYVCHGCRLVFPPARWPIMPPLMGVYVFTDRLAFAAADWCLRLHGWPIMPSLLGVYDSTTGLPPSSPTGVSACTLAYYATVDGRLRLHRPACLRRRRLVSPSARLAYYAVVVGRLRLHHRPASIAADWCFRLHGWPIMPSLLGVYDSTTGLPPSSPTGVSACTLAYYATVDGRLRLHRPACLRRRRLVSPSARLAYYAVVVGRLRLHHRPASIAADWCFRLHGWPIMPPLLGVYVFIDRPPRPPPTGVTAYTAGLLCRCCWASTSSSPLPLLMDIIVFRRRLVMPPPTGAFIFTTARLHHRISTWTSSTHIFNQAMTIRRQEATVLDSMFSCFPTNQRVGGYTNTRLKI